METTINLSEASLQRLGDILVEKILYAKNRPEPWIDIKELSEHLGKSVSSIHHDVERNGLPCLRGGKRLRFKLSEVETWLRRNK